MTITDIVTSIDQRLTQAKAEVAQLDGARPALTNGAVPAATRNPAARAAYNDPHCLRDRATRQAHRAEGRDLRSTHNNC